MNFETKILEASNIKERKLLKPASMAAKNPDTGITVHNKSAYFVIRDCASITQKYLVLHTYGSLNDPLNELKGKFTEKDIIDFIARVPKEVHTKQLLYLIFTDIAKAEGNAVIGHEAVVETNVITDFSEEDVDNIYGDYDYVHSDKSTPPEEEVSDQLLSIDLTDNRAVIDKLIEVFAAIRGK
tara:strand:+ start:754 stop:1302 length:549 start_codon:yes stop_codon:yes gene_type:complete